MKMSLGLEYLQIQILCSVLSFVSLCHFLCLVSFFSIYVFCFMGVQSQVVIPEVTLMVWEYQ